MVKINRRLRRPSSHTRLLSRVTILDVIWGGVSPAIAYLLRDGTIYSPAGVAGYCCIAFIVSLVVFQWFQTSSPISRFYSIRDALELIKACVLIAALSAVISFLLTRLQEAPRSIPILHFMLLASVLIGARILLRLRDTQRETRAIGDSVKAEHVLILQASRLAWFFSKMIEELSPGGYQIVAILDERSILKNRSLNGYPIIGGPLDLEKVIADYAMHGVRIDKVVVAAQPEELSPPAWIEVSRVCHELNIELEVLPDRLMSREVANDDDEVFDCEADEPATLELNALRLDRPFWRIKRAIDFAVSLVLWFLLSPMMVLVCALVLVDVGVPIVFWQRRVGQNGTPFHLYKFRTLQTLFDRQTNQRREAQEPDAVGRFLRKTRLDELPQLWNVLRGDMAMIGPRPLLPIDQPQGTSCRLAVRPGVTGWAQVCGGTLISVDEKTALDEWYIRHASLGRDAVIMLRTIRMFLVGDRRDETAIAVALSERTESPAASPTTAAAGAAPLHAATKPVLATLNAK